MGEWREVRLGDLLTRITYGFTNPMPKASDGPRLVAAKDIRGGRIDYDSARFTTWEAYKTLLTDKSRPRVGDLLLTKDGSIGRVAICDRADVCINQSVALLQLNELVRPRFLAYLLQAPIYQQRMAADADGSTIKHIYITRVDKMLVDLPPLEDQQAIAEVLGALDDKIAANDRASGLCMDLADAEFCQVIAGVALSDRTFGDIADVGGGGTPRTKTEEFWNGDIPWATPTDITALAYPFLESTGRMITEAGLAACASRLYPRGSILMTSRATIGAFAVAQTATAVNQGFIVVNSHQQEMQPWLFHEMRLRVPEFISHANGATFLELSRGKFKAMRVHHPSEQVAQQFAAVVDPLHRHVATLQRESAKLASTRDELLPLLMSGRIRVKDAEGTVGEVL